MACFIILGKENFLLPCVLIREFFSVKDPLISVFFLNEIISNFTVGGIFGIFVLRDKWNNDSGGKHMPS
jgi:hypothetical protein